MAGEICPECFDGAHRQCIGQGCYCDCQIPNEDGEDEDELEGGLYFDCGMDQTGACGKAGSEECEFECPYRAEQRLGGQS